MYVGCVGGRKATTVSGSFANGVEGLGSLNGEPQTQQLLGL